MGASGYISIIAFIWHYITKIGCLVEKSFDNQEK